MHLFVDKLTNIDFSYLHPQRGLLGETWLVDIALSGTLDSESMVCDFGIVKKSTKQWFDQAIDHRLLVPKLSPYLSIERDNNQLTLEWRFGDNQYLTHSSPVDAIALIDAETITQESVSAWCIDQLKSIFPQSIEKLHLAFSCEVINGPYYQYSHGLKKHRGNCQRIAHGHRSKIQIWRNGKMDELLMNNWSERWRDIYLGSEEDISLSNKSKAEDFYHFEYEAKQGKFSLTLPKQCCEIINRDTTVECLSLYIAEQLRQDYPTDDFVIKAYEGLGKGAISES